MLIQLVAHHPEALGTIVRRTPIWVWGLLAVLTALGASQLRARTAGLVRVSLMPLGMTLFSIWGTVTAFGASPLLAQALAVWIAAAVVVFALVVRTQANARYDAASRTYAIPGSVIPLALIAGIFMVKYTVGVELAMAPQLLRDTQYALTVAALYGAFTGMFVGRAARLWRLAYRAPATLAAA
ncbi:MAG: putative rane protein [Ramlibacter sp.]|nr:putative rane protein [Ramlibacter sp.]